MTGCPLPSSVDSLNLRSIARSLYGQGWTLAAIARHLKQKYATVAAWKQREQWERLSGAEKVVASLEDRLTALIAREEKAGKDFKEIDLLTRQIERLSHGVPDKNKAQAVKKLPRNALNEEQQDKLREAFIDSLFDYQKRWYQNGHQRTRNLLKSRQIGATWYFAREALIDALTTGRNQIFLSASKAQAQIFRQYVVQFVQDVTGMELRGEPIVLANHATLYFLSTNARTAQSYHGNFYFDEYFWTPQFTTLNKVASGMAMHAKWRKTYFSTPSSLNHEAYPFWSGEHANRGRQPEKHIQVDTSYAALKAGQLGNDQQWRQIVTVEDAVSQGCNLFDLAQLKNEYSPEDYQNLLMCQFIDDTASVFTLADCQRCMVDAWVEWEDFKPLAQRPLGHASVWIGYDPSLSRDAAGCVVIAPPTTNNARFRVLEKYQWRNIDFEAQAEHIKKITERYHVTYIGIDTTGMGQGVFQLVKRFFPAVTGLNYSPEVKNRLVLKGQAVIRRGRLAFDASWTDLAQALMSIRQTLTASGRQVTYQSHRNEIIGHADLAWACLHALDHEPLAGADNHGFMEFYS